MITLIKVNGFRSLSSFSLDLVPGLNILVGPNGSGKTNIITFFEFLSYVVSYGPSEAVNRLGGAGSVFTKISELEFLDHIDVEVQGCAESKPNEFVKYRYAFVIEASENFDLIKFRSQEIGLQNSSTFSLENDGLQHSFTARQYTKDGKVYSYELLNYKKTMVDPSFFPRSLQKKFVNNKEMSEQFLANNSAPDLPLFSGLSYFVNAAIKVVGDLRGGQIFNIIPSRVKTPEESSSSVGIKKDGSGLAATLYAIKSQKVQREWASSARFMRWLNPEINLKNVSLDDILRYLVTANPSIKRLDVDNDRFDNLLKVKFWIEKEDHATVLPLAAMSDGTIKWLSLVTAILTSPAILSLEEPENFLHPFMQSEVVKLMRSATESGPKRLPILMSTHSETILNAAKPSEIVIVSFNDGMTSAGRCHNQTELVEEIKKTGFGLGFYYISGSLSNE